MNHKAAVLLANKGHIVINSVEQVKPKAGQILIKNKAVAINPFDWIIQEIGSTAFRWLKYPLVLGSDTAGEVIAVGPDVSRFNVGDRVIGHAVGTDQDVNSSSQSAFQEYTILRENMSTPIPDSMTFEEGAVLPLAVSTASTGLFQSDQLALTYPTLNSIPNNKVVLIWGGSTSVGSNAIQLAKSAGYTVVTTASPHNFEYVKSLGADMVFDYKDNTTTQKVISYLKGKELAGTLAIGTGSSDKRLAIVHQTNGSKRLAAASTPVSFENGSNLLSFAKLGILTALLLAKSKLWKIHTKNIYGSTIKNNEVSKAIYEDFLPKALADKTYIAVPKAEIVGSGLESIELAMNTQRRGVNTKKLVVTL